MIANVDADDIDVVNGIIKSDAADGTAAVFQAGGWELGSADNAAALAEAASRAALPAPAIASADQRRPDLTASFATVTEAAREATDVGTRAAYAFLYGMQMPSGPPEPPTGKMKNSTKMIDRHRREEARRTRAFMFGQIALKSKDPSYCGVVANAITVLLGQQPGPRGATTSGVSDTVHALFTSLGVARNKSNYNDMLKNLLVQFPEPWDATSVGKDDVTALSFDNLEFMCVLGMILMGSHLLQIQPLAHVALAHEPLALGRLPVESGLLARHGAESLCCRVC